MRIKAVRSGSMAQALGILPGENVVVINDQVPRDVIDYRYLIAEEEVDFVVENPSAGRRLLHIHKEIDEELGLDFEEILYRTCPNHCIFCFVDQLPPGLRKELYFKDEDYRLSFLHGSFITLTNLTEDDIDRIVSQRISPLYISVHSTEPELRRTMLGNPRAPDLMGIVSQLAEGGVELHAQVVLCPGINDGQHLRRTLEDLALFYPQLRSVALVPVGLTTHRGRLFPLRPVDGEYARLIMGEVDTWRREFRRCMGSGLVYLADEFFLLAGQEVPSTAYYDGFWQVENGVGMVRQFLDEYRRAEREFPERLSSPLSVKVVTGVLASTLWRRAIERLNGIRGLRAELIVVENELFGPSVTVSGLLAGRDILKTLSSQCSSGDRVILPGNCLNDGGLFLDDVRVEDLSSELEVEVCVAEGIEDVVTLLR